MSFPYYSDLYFGSEQSTADPNVSRVPESTKEESEEESEKDPKDDGGET